MQVTVMDNSRWLTVHGMVSQQMQVTVMHNSRWLTVHGMVSQQMQVTVMHNSRWLTVHGIATNARQRCIVLFYMYNKKAKSNVVEMFIFSQIQFFLSQGII